MSELDFQNGLVTGMTLATKLGATEQALMPGEGEYPRFIENSYVPEYEFLWPSYSELTFLYEI